MSPSIAPRGVARSRDDQTADWLPAELGILCTVGAIIEIITWWLRQEPGAYPVEQIATVLHHFPLVPLLGPTDWVISRGHP